MKTLIQKDTHTSMFKAALFTIAKIWKQPIWQSTDKWIKTWYLYTQGFPSGSDSKDSACNVGDLGLIPGLGRFPGGGHDNPLQYSCPEKPYEQRILAGCSPWDCTEFDTTEQLRTAHFVLGYSQLTMLWKFQMSSKGTQPYIYMYPFSPKLPFYPGCQIPLSRVPRAVQ